MKPLLALALLLTVVAPVQALPVEIQGLAWLNAPPCGWEGMRLDALIAAGPITPPCSRGLQINVLASLNGTEASDFYFTSIHDPGRGHANTLIHHEVRPNTMAGRVQNVSLEDLPNGRNRVSVAIGNSIHVYDFILERPNNPNDPGGSAGGGGLTGPGGSQPIETPDPATLLMIGASAVGVAWWRKRRRP